MEVGEIGTSEEPQKKGERGPLVQGADFQG